MSRFPASLAIALFILGQGQEVDAQRRRRPPRRERVTQQPARPAEARERAQDATFRLESLNPPGGLSSEEVVERALALAPAVEQARAMASASAAESNAALWEMMPRVSVQGQFTHVGIRNENLSAGLPEDQRALIDPAIAAVSDPFSRQLFGALFGFRFPVVEDMLAFQARVTIPISDLFLTLLPAYLAADELAAARARELQAVHATLALRAREAFYNVLRTRGAMAVANAALANAESHRRQVELMTIQGALPAIDLRRVEAQAAAAAVAQARAEGGLAVAEEALRGLLRLRPEEEVSVGEDLQQVLVAESKSRAEVIEAAMTRRPELLALREAAAARSSAATAQAGKRWPQVLLTAGIDHANPNTQIFPLVNEFRTTWNVGVVASWSPTDALVQQARYDARSADERAARAAVDAAEQQARVEAVAALAERRAASLAYDAARVGLEAAEASYRGRVAQLRNGAAVTADLLAADADLSAARLALVNAAVDVRIAAARLRRAIGD